MSPWSSEPHDIWPGIYDSLPVEFGPFRDEPAFSMSDVTFCIWRQYSDAAWQCGVREFPQGDDPDGSKWMLEILDGNPATYRAYARDYFEVDLPITAIRHIYDLKPVDDDVVRALNGELTAAMVDGDVRDIGYPRGAGGHQV